MKVRLPLCMCLVATCTQLMGCGAPADGAEPSPGITSNAPENGLFAPSASGAESGIDATESVTHTECPDLGAEQMRCGQIALTMKGVGSSCQLVPTVNDLTRPPRSVRFDCGEIPRGPDGYDFDTLGHITLMGDTCAALQKDGPHRVTLNLSCAP